MPIARRSQLAMPGFASRADAMRALRQHVARPAAVHAMNERVPEFFSIGHSTRPIETFLSLLRDNGVRALADVRLIAGSRRHPQFGHDALARSLADAGIGYEHMPALGGRRRASADSLNTAWQNASFRGYADYMQTNDFSRALDRLIDGATRGPTAIMCAEAVPWRCHRSLIADALVARGHDVRDITGTSPPKLHRLTPWARVDGGRVSYPALDTSSSSSRE